MKTSTLAVLAVCFASPAFAFELEYPTDLNKIEPPRRAPQVRAWKQYAPPPKVTITRNVAITVEPAKPKPEPRCKPWLSALGDTAKSIEAAKLEGLKAIKSRVQYEYGSKFMDVVSADAVEFQCAPSAPPVMGGRVEEALGKMLPIQSYYCKVSVSPCEATVQREYMGK